jgi:PKD repeat protein
LLQKILVVLVGLVMSIVGALAPSQLFASQKPTDLAGHALDGVQTKDEALSTVRNADGAAFAKLGVLWVESEGARLTEDAWGTGEVKELRFEVGTKNVDGLSLAVGDKVVPVKPTDVITVRMFQGDFAYRNLGTSEATLQLQGTVKTTLVDQGSATGKLQTATTGVLGGASATRSGGPGDTQRISFVTLDTGQAVDTVDLTNGGSRLLTNDETTTASATQAGNLLVKWVKVSGKSVDTYTWGNGEVDRIEFAPASGAGDASLMTFDGQPTGAPANAHVLVQGFVGEYLVYQTSTGLLRLRLDGYAANVTTGAADVQLGKAAGATGPLPAFEVGPNPAHTTDVLQFKDRSIDDGVIVLWRWSFGDGTSTVVQQPTHKYARPGVYNVTLNVTDDDLDSAETTQTVVVNNADPIPDFDVTPRVVTTDTLIALSDHSIDPDGYVVNWSWDFGDGTTSYARHPNHHFEKSGTLPVTLTVTDDLGAHATLTKQVLVRNSPPHAAFEFAPTTIYANQDVRFHSTSTDSDGTVVDAVWSFGAGPSDTARGSDVTHRFPHPGVFDVALTATDNMGDSDTTSTRLTVINQYPDAEFSYTPAHATAQDNVTFDGSPSSDPDGFIILDEWDFGDGTNTSVRATVDTCAGGPTSPDCQRALAVTATYDPMRVNASNTQGGNPPYAPPPGYQAPAPIPHRFPRMGTYVVTLCVTDNLLAQSCMNRTVGIDNSLPFADMDIKPSPAFRNATIHLQDTSTDADDQPVRPIVVSWTIDGVLDGSTSHDLFRTYATLGNHTATLVVKDSAGAQGSVTKAFSVVNAPPVIRSITPDIATPPANVPVNFTVDAIDPDTSSPLTFAWSFSDGGTAGDVNATTHTFAALGLYTVTVTATDVDGASRSLTVPITVIVEPPIPDFNVTCSPCAPPHEDEPTVGQPTTFNDTSQPNGANITKWSWSFGDGATFTTTNAAQRNVTHTYTTGTPSGAYTVTLTLSSTNSPDTTAARQVHVNSPPHADFIAPVGTQDVHAPSTFTDTSTDPDGQTTLDHAMWDFGDGTPWVNTTDLTVQHTFETSGTHLVTLTQYDDHGATGVAQKQVAVDDRAPTARFNNSAPAVANSPVQFLDQSSDPEGNDTIVYWRWNFGDGTGNLEGVQNPQHTFAHSGVYSVSLVVGDGNLYSAPYIKRVRVGADHPITIEVNATLPDGTGVPLPKPGYAVTLSLTASGGDSVTLGNDQMVALGANGAFTLEAGVWAGGYPDGPTTGDQVTITIDYKVGVMTKDQIVQQPIYLRDGDTDDVVGPMIIKLPVTTTIQAVGDNDTTLLGTDPPAYDGGTVYHDLFSPFHGVGNVTFADGTPVKNAEVHVQLRYAPLEPPGSSRSLRDGSGLLDQSDPTESGVLGWCDADVERTDAHGNYTWDATNASCLLEQKCSAGISLLPCLGKPAIFLFGHWQARAYALVPSSETRMSSYAEIFVDPTGVFAATYLP